MFRMLRSDGTGWRSRRCRASRAVACVRVVGAGTSWRRLVDAVDVARGARDRSVQERRRASRQREEARRRGGDQAGSRRRKDHRQGEDRIREVAQGLQERGEAQSRACTRRTTAWATPIARPATTRRRSKCTIRRLSCAPGFFPEAVEYRAEAYLALNRIDDARQAYLDLFAADRKQADILMDAMKKWVASRQAAPAGVAPDAITGFEKWIGEREGVAKQTQLMAISTKYAGW